MLKIFTLVGLLASSLVQAQVTKLEEKDFWCVKTAECYAKNAVCAVEYCVGPPSMGSCALDGPAGFVSYSYPVRNVCCGFADPHACFQAWQAAHKGNGSDGTTATSTFTSTLIDIPTTGATINTAATLISTTFYTQSASATTTVSGSLSTSTSSLVSTASNAAATGSLQGREAGLYLAGGLALAALL